MGFVKREGLRSEGIQLLVKLRFIVNLLVFVFNSFLQKKQQKKRKFEEFGAGVMVGPRFTG